MTSMRVNDILTFIAQVFFVSLSLIALYDYIRHPNPRRRDFVLFASALGLPLGITLINTLFGYKSGLLDLLGAIALFAQPYFLFRLLQYYRPLRRWLHWCVLGGMVLCWVVLFGFMASYPVGVQVFIFGYGVVVDAYCAWAYHRGAQQSVGTLRRRLRLITISSAFFALALAGNAVKAVWPEVAQPVSSVGLTVTALSAVLYYIAFIPPHWMRHAWYFEELRDYLAHHDLLDQQGMLTAENFQQLCAAACQAVNGMWCAVVRPQEGESTWEIVSGTDLPQTEATLPIITPLLMPVWERRQASTIYVPYVTDSEMRRALTELATRTWLIVPIVSPARTWGMLIVVLRERALFIDDDLRLLELFAQQEAIRQENSRLLRQLQGYSEQLASEVEARTSELRASEAALLELNATLEQRVEQRTAELRRSNEELDQFAYVASHDLKAPLRAINHLAGWIEQDAGDLLPETTREHLNKLQQRVQRMETLLNDLLAYSRVGRQRHPIETVRLASLIDDVTEIVSPPPGFVVDTRSDLELQVERTPLETVFRNLIGNAVKHHHRANHGCVEVRAELQDDLVKFTVADDGPGVPPEYHARMFEIFTTLRPRDQLEGSGIGLAIVKKSVESRGGEIWIESDAGKGTAIHFTWPQNGHQ